MNAFFNKYFYIYIIIYIFLLFYKNNSPLWEQDEAAYAGFATNMIESGNWVIPDFPFSEPHRKTPLHYWITAIMFQAFGNSEFVLRLSSSIFLLLSLVLTWVSGNRILGNNRGVWGAVILSGSFFLILYGKIALVDSALLFFEILAVYGLLGIYQKKNLFFSISLMVIAVSLALLVKGPPVLILLTGIIFTMTVTGFFNGRIVWLPFIFFPLVILSIIPLVVWGRIAWISDNGKFISWLVDWYILKRTTGAVFGQSGPPGYYLLLFFLTLFPWTFVFPSVIKWITKMFFELYQSIRNKTKFHVSLEEQFVFAWIASGWLVYELMISKLPSYILGAYPAVAIIAGKQIGLFLEKKTDFGKATGLLPFIGFILLFLITGIIYYYKLSYLFYILEIAIGVLFYFVYNSFIADNRERTVLLVAFSSLIFIAFFWSGIAQSLEFRYGPEKFAQKIRNDYPDASSVIFASNPSIPGIAYYLHRLGFKIEMAGTPESLKKKLQDSPVVALMPETFSIITEFNIKADQEYSVLAYDRGKELIFSLFFEKKTKK